MKALKDNLGDLFKGMDNLDVQTFFLIDRCASSRALTKLSQAWLYIR